MASKIFIQGTMPYKLTLTHIKSGRKHTFYKSTQEFLAYDESKFDAHIQDTKEQKSNQQKLQMPSMF